MTNTIEERRKYTRIDFNTEVTLAQNEASYKAKLADISLKGLLAETPQNYTINVDSPIEATIALSDDVTITMTLQLAHSSDSLLGFRCESIDMESISHLRRLIELNIDDSEAADRVLYELLELHH